MAKLTITGSTKPVVGNVEAYSLAVFDNLISSNSFSFPPVKIQWNIHVQDRKGWRTTHGNKKEGEQITYKFTHKSLQYKALKIEVTRGKDKGELYIKPKHAEEPKILRIDLLDINSQRLKKGKLLHYTDALIAKAYCVGMFGHKVSFTLWEDDAIGKGHDPVINMMNRINPVPLVGEVDHEGIAKVIFRLPSYTMAVQIANAQVAEGDKNEGKAHEYYVTAEMISKHILKASPNVNIANPTHIPELPEKQKSKETSPPHRKSPVAPEKKEVKPGKPKPKEDTPKFPQTPAAKKQADPEGKIISAAFTDAAGKPLKNAKTGDAVSIKIVTQSMKGKNVMVRIWEEDFSLYSNDLMYEKPITLTYDTNNFINGIILTKAMYTKSYEWGEGNEREYFIEVEHLNTSVTSQVIPVSAGAEPMKVEANDSVVVINEKKEEKKINCICQEQYKDLIWSGKVSCDFRKKVVEICKDLWPKNYMVMANNLMACMAWETGESFSPSAKNPKSTATGLIQFMADTAKDLGTTTSALAKMTAVKQLDYVKKYFENIRNKDYEFVDFYLRILFPASMGKSDEHVVFSRDGEGLNKGDRNYKERINAYGVNSGFDTNPKYGNGDGMVTKAEIKKGIQKYIEKGKLNKGKFFDCQKGNAVATLLPEKGTWNVIITEHYTGNKCTHLERTPIRNNCRRGKIEVFDDNSKVVFTIVDCLLEGIKGEDRSETSADVPYGAYKINESTPFYSSTAANKITYGPNPRLVFEPIKGSKDEADNSGRSSIRIHGGRQEGYPVKTLKRTEGCIRIYDKDAKDFYNWWIEFKKTDPGVKPGKVIIKK
ncbi:L,D-transpeptidase family protein [Chryseobacterium sp. BIGb0232]|uniref:L,D-transpeptidase family protein n=1 Tax=Chryseobacterium sp. BIGb0232 TaxID=2940598 RepID=UPI000F480599|nr:L,D-transpeptidase family protein [Chryseobacterium sp. BIGb0232]MCS4300627.1 hypothetical protein [Chryseobacterium sp. BIGb0232]ROS20488.1 L,D-transpeptidase-like protein [Chryseobacterium nakagawai]